jgi:hypothetical protein
MADTDLRRLSSHVPKPIANARLVRADYVHGRQWGVDSVVHGAPYVFSRYVPDAMWMIWAGPFATEDLAVQWIQELK